MNQLQQLLERIQAPDRAVAPQVQDRLDNLTKPRGSLGVLEDLAMRLCVIRGSAKIAQPKPAVAVFAADHGVAAEGVSAFPPEVTPQMVFNFLAGGAGINALSRQAGAEVVVVDVGVNHDFQGVAGLIDAKVRMGSGNMAVEPAMSPAEAEAAIMAGAKVAADLIEQGHDMLVPGDMGIANTTACAAITSVMCGLSVADVTGRGTGVDDGGLNRKVAAIEKALSLHRPNPDNAFGVLCAVGGLEIAAICGYILEAAARKVPVVLDGFISTSGAMIASGLCPASLEYCFAGHGSVEIGHRSQLRKLGLEPIVDLRFRLGEGTGAVVAVSVIRHAVAMYNDMATFAEAGVIGEEV